MEEFVDIGTKMGLSGKDLVEFVEKKRKKRMIEKKKEKEKNDREERNK